MNDEQLLLAWLEHGNKEALGELYGRLTPRILSTLRKYTRRRDLAEDAIQNAFVKIVEGRGYKRGTAAVSYATYLAVCELKDIVKRKCESTQSLRIDVAEQPAPIADVVPRSPDHDLLQMVYVDGMSYREAATSLKTTPTDLDHRIRAAKARLRLAAAS